MNNIIELFREYSGDNCEPYFFCNNAIINSLKNALKQYSAQYPLLKKGRIQIVPEKQIYQFPNDYQTWYKGLEKYEIVNNNVVIKSNACKSIAFLYYADRTMDEIPENHVSLFLSYCYGDLLEEKVLHLTEQEVLESNIKTMKLGRGLELTFEDSKNSKEMLFYFAKNKKQPFLDLLKGCAIGGWC